MELRPLPTAGRDDRSPVVAPHLHGRGPRRDATGSKACALASPQLQETPEIVGVVSNTEPRSKSNQRLASRKVVPFRVIRGRAVCVERRTYGSWGGTYREVGPYPTCDQIAFNDHDSSQSHAHNGVTASEAGWILRPWPKNQVSDLSATRVSSNTRVANLSLRNTLDAERASALPAVGSSMCRFLS
jgi:hypothetical protein